MAKIVRQTLREQVTQAIRMMLLTGELEPGTRIVEQDLAQELGVSRGPVREADVYEVYLLRANLEILAVKMCDGVFSPETIVEMEQIVRDMASIRGVEQFDETIENDNRFHACIVKAAQFKRLYTLWDSMAGENTIVFYRGSGKSEYVVRNQERIHQMVLDAVKSGDVQRISKALMEHYMDTISGYLKSRGTSVEDFPYRIDFDL